MKPIFTIYHPLPQVALIQIFPPHMRDNETISFFVKIDQSCIALDLSSDGAWSAKGFARNYSTDIFKLIEQKIESYY